MDAVHKGPDQPLSRTKVADGQGEWLCKSLNSSPSYWKEYFQETERRASSA